MLLTSQKFIFTISTFLSYYTSSKVQPAYRQDCFDAGSYSQVDFFSLSATMSLSGMDRLLAVEQIWQDWREGHF